MNEDTTLNEFVEAESGSSERETEDLARKTVCGIPPQDWTVARLGELVRVVSGNSLPTEYQNGQKGEYPVYKVSDMNATGNKKYISDTSNRLSKEDLEEINHTLYPEGTTILPKVGAALLTNKRRLLTEPSSFDNNVMGWVPDEINPEFLYYVSCIIDMEAVAQKGAVPSISKAIAKSLKVPSPPLPEQRKIATVLYTVDRAIEKTEEIIRQLERVRDGIAQDIFTTGYYNHSEYSDVRLGPVKTSTPEDWSVNLIPDYFEIIDGDRGKNYPSGSDFSDQGYCLFLSATNVTEDGLKFDETEFITQQKDGELRKGKLKRGDIIMTTRGTVGNFGLYDESVNYENIRINSGMVILRPKDSVSSVEYYYHFFRSGIFQRQINATSYGTAQPQTSVTDIKKMGILEPGEDEKEKISELIEDTVSEIKTQKGYRNQLQLIKHGLQQDLLSGTVRTTDTNIEVPDQIAQHG